jgi:manganese/iron transport system ATP-binding protein
MALIKEIERTEHALKHDYARHDTHQPILKVTNLTVQYGSGYALNDISFEIPRAMRLAVLGPNGAGKSTLLKVIAGILSPTQGTVQVFGNEPGTHICIAYVPQRSLVDWTFPIDVREVVMMGRISKLGLLRRPSRADWRIVDRALEVVKLTGLAHRQIGELSGGQQQRMFIARALAQEAELMLMDEPLTGLDATSQEDIFSILDALREQHVTVLVALHDLKMAAERFDTVMLLNHTLIGLGAYTEVFTSERLATAYGARRVSPDNFWLEVDESCCEGDHEHH